MSEYLEHMGRRAELRQKLMSLKIMADSHRESLRLALDPVAEAGDLDAEKIMLLAAALAEAVTDIKETESRLAAIANIIGH